MVPSDEEDAPNVKAVKDLVLYLWDNYLECVTSYALTCLSLDLLSSLL